MSIVHVDKIWVEIAKNFEMRTSGGGGWSVISDTPGRGGAGGQKGQIFADVLYGWPWSLKFHRAAAPFSCRGDTRHARACLTLLGQ